MGAWGTSPFSSDSFGDMFDGVRRDLAQAVTSTLFGELAKTEEMGVHEPSEQWAWVGLVIWAYHAGFSVDQPTGRAKKTLIGEAERIVDALRSDRVFMDMWRDKARFKKTIDQVAEQLSDIRGGYERPGVIPALEDEFDHAKAPRRKR